MDAAEIIRRLSLVPLAGEGGFFRETYRSALATGGPSLPGHAARPRSAGTAIYYLLTPDTFSALHRLPVDEIFHFYAGDPVEMLQLGPDRRGTVERIGADLGAGSSPQVVVPALVWQGCRLAPGGRLALMGTTMAPGFDPADLELGDRGTLTAAFPEHAERIAALTPS